MEKVFKTSEVDMLRKTRNSREEQDHIFNTVVIFELFILVLMVIKISSIKHIKQFYISHLFLIFEHMTYI